MRTTPSLWALAAVLVAALVAWPLRGGARDTSVLTHNPYPWSVLSPHPYHPSFCSVFSHHPCQPDINYPFGQDLRLTIKSRSPEPPEPSQQVAAASPADDKTAEKNADVPEHKLDTIADMFTALRGCWVPPAKDASRAGMQMSVRLSFKRNGEPMGAPRITFVTPDTPPELRRTYLDAITASLKRCTPLPFTPGLGGALAGRPIAIRFIDDRSE
jgi:hypothetical protein